jgi:aerobic-type carbon monoxide dehydrogenase small subunit (CoxS/CutS family)
MAITFTLNGKPQSVEVSPDMPLLWVLRDTLNMTGTKFGCGMSLCGACTVHVNGEATRSCITAISSVAGKKVTTIEGLSADGSHPVQLAWMEEDVPQCGYCQSGQIMSAARTSASEKPFTAPRPCQPVSPSPPPDYFETVQAANFFSEVLHGDSSRCKPS